MGTQQAKNIDNHVSQKEILTTAAGKKKLLKTKNSVVNTASKKKKYWQPRQAKKTCCKQKQILTTTVGKNKIDNHGKQKHIDKLTPKTPSKLSLKTSFSQTHTKRGQANSLELSNKPTSNTPRKLAPKHQKRQFENAWVTPGVFFPGFLLCHFSKNSEDF